MIHVATERGSQRGTRTVTRFLAPAVLAVLTWLVVLVAIGVLSRFGSPSILNLLSLVVVVVMVYPLTIVAPWRPDLTERLTAWARRNWHGVAGGAVLFVVRLLPVPGLVGGLLDLPFRSAGMLFGAKLFYAQRLGEPTGQLLLSFGQWYLELLWLFLLGTGLARAVWWFR